MPCFTTAESGGRGGERGFERSDLHRISISHDQDGFEIVITGLDPVIHLLRKTRYED